VKRSWKFQREVWTGYRHARTLGVVKGGGGWKGEEREARMFEFVRKGEGIVPGKGKEKGGESSGDEDLDSENEEGISGEGSEDLELDVDMDESKSEDATEEETWEGIETAPEDHDESNDDD